jgi:small subunit ribosomal protein S4
MARLKAKGKIARKFGMNLFGNPKFDRLLERRPAIKTQRKRRPTVTEYGKQLIEKQKVRFHYEVGERQLRNIFEDAQSMAGERGFNMLVLLELKLDNVVCRMGLASTIAQARQVINHGHIQVNGKTVDIGSFELRPGDTVSVHPRERSRHLLDQLVAQNKSRTPPEWLSFSKVDLSGRVERAPVADEIPPIADPRAIVEFYSK